MTRPNQSIFKFLIYFGIYVFCLDPIFLFIGFFSGFEYLLFLMVKELFGLEDTLYIKIYPVVVIAYFCVFYFLMYIRNDYTYSDILFAIMLGAILWGFFIYMM